ncbi:MAG: hypothetical protein LAP13_24660 [Acidobacteriia bacterium]|nr:hypothetical protein [Terriglobia bacterium]
MRRLISALILLILVSAAGFSQTADPWANLNQLRSGQKINVVGLDRKKISVSFLDATEDGLRFRYEGKEVVLPRSEVLIVSMKPPADWKQILLGLAAGAAIGYGAWSGADMRERGCLDDLGYYCASDQGLSGRSAAIATGVGAGVGVLVAALVKGNERVLYAYDAEQSVEMPAPMPALMPVVPIALLDLQPGLAEFEEGVRSFAPVVPTQAPLAVPANGPA